MGQRRRQTCVCRAIKAWRENGPARVVSLEEIERRHELRVLAADTDNRARAAAVLGIDPKTLYRTLRGWHGTSSSTPPASADIALL